MKYTQHLQQHNVMNGSRHQGYTWVKKEKKLQRLTTCNNKHQHQLPPSCQPSRSNLLHSSIICRYINFSRSGRRKMCFHIVPV
jgi:hypothetical protein